MKYTGLEHVVGLVVLVSSLAITGNIFYALIAVGGSLTVASYLLKRDGITIAIYFAATLIVAAIMKAFVG